MMQRRTIVLGGILLMVVSALRLYNETSLPVFEIVPDAMDKPSVTVSSATVTGDPKPLEIGRDYSARACQLEPGWGTIGSNDTVCVGRKPVLANTTAGHLSCFNEKPILTDRPHEGLTIALLYFAKPALLFRQLEEFATYPPNIQEKLTILIIDDGSPPGLQVIDYLNMTTYISLFRLRLAHITTDRDWNIGGARNLAFYLIDTARTLLLDLDVLVPKEAMEVAITWPVWDDQHFQVAHRFNRRRADGSENKHPAVTVIRTDAYWENGGCDEDFCGNYGFTDVHFWFRWKADPAHVLMDHLDVYLYGLEMIACDEAYLTEEGHFTKCKDAKSKLVKPKRNLKKNFALYKTKTKVGCWSNKYLRFRWRLIH